MEAIKGVPNNKVSEFRYLKILRGFKIKVTFKLFLNFFFVKRYVQKLNLQDNAMTENNK